MRWKVHGRRSVYRSDWLELRLDDVEIPGGPRFGHHVLHFPKGSATAVALKDDQVLLLWRHRFITDTWGWEVPAGWLDHGETPETAVRREVEEETGWRPGTVTPMTEYYASNGISDQRFTAFVAEDLAHIGPPTDATEATRVEWHSLADIPQLIEAGHLTDGPSLLALSYYLGIWRPLRL